MESESFDQASHWAKRVCDCWHKSVISLIETGNPLIEARRALNHGEWQYMFDKDKMGADTIPFGQSTADKLMRIARRFTT